MDILKFYLNPDKNVLKIILYQMQILKALTECYIKWKKRMLANSKFAANQDLPVR